MSAAPVMSRGKEKPKQRLHDRRPIVGQTDQNDCEGQTDQE